MSDPRFTTDATGFAGKRELVTGGAMAMVRCLAAAGAVVITSACRFHWQARYGR